MLCVGGRDGCMHGGELARNDGVNWEMLNFTRCVQGRRQRPAAENIGISEERVAGSLVFFAFLVRRPGTFCCTCARVYLRSVRFTKCPSGSTCCLPWCSCIQCLGTARERYRKQKNKSASHRCLFFIFSNLRSADTRPVGRGNSIIPFVTAIFTR